MVGRAGVQSGLWLGIVLGGAVLAVPPMVFTMATGHLGSVTEALKASLTPIAVIFGFALAVLSPTSRFSGSADSEPDDADADRRRSAVLRNLAVVAALATVATLVHIAVSAPGAGDVGEFAPERLVGAVAAGLVVLSFAMLFAAGKLDRLLDQADDPFPVVQRLFARLVDGALFAAGIWVWRESAEDRVWSDAGWLFVALFAYEALSACVGCSVGKLVMGLRVYWAPRGHRGEIAARPPMCAALARAATLTAAPVVVWVTYAWIETSQRSGQWWELGEYALAGAATLVGYGVWVSGFAHRAGQGVYDLLAGTLVWSSKGPRPIARADDGPQAQPDTAGEADAEPDR